MKKQTIRLVAAILAALLLLSCTALAEGQLPYRIATKDEGAALLLGNTEYSDRLTQINLDYRVQKKGATIEDWQKFAAKQVLDFTDAERAALTDGMAAVEEVLAGNGYVLPELDELVFVRTTQREECDSGAYTLGNQIYLGETLLEYLGSEDKDERLLARSALCHEIFHCLTRRDPQFRSDMYAIIHFTTHEEEYVLSPQLQEIYFTNPDVGRHDASATFVIDGKETECYIVCILKQPFEKPGDSAFSHAGIALVPVDDPDHYFKRGDAENFWQVFGHNTDYVLDPEECLADNFGYALMCEDTDPEGKPFSNPEILDAIRDYLKK